MVWCIIFEGLLKCLPITLCFLLSVATASKADETFSGGYPIALEYADSDLDFLRREGIRENAIQWHRQLVDKYNILLNLISHVHGLSSGQLEKIELPYIYTAKITPKGYIKNKKIKPFEAARAELGGSSLLGTLKNRNLDDELLAELTNTLDAVESWLDQAEKAYFKNRIISKQIRQHLALGTCVDASDLSLNNPITDEHEKLLHECLKRQRVALNGEILTYDGIKKNVDASAVLVVVKSPLPKPSPPKPSPKDTNVAHESGGNASTNADDQVTSANPGSLDTIYSSQDKLRSDAVGKSIGSFRSDKRTKKSRSKLKTDSEFDNIKLRDSNKVTVEEYKAARKKQAKEREKVVADLVKNTFADADKKIPPPPTPNTIDNTKLDEKTSKDIGSTKLRAKREIFADAAQVLSAAKSNKKSKFDYGSLLLEFEITDSSFDDKNQVFRHSMERYTKLITKYKNLAKTLNSLDYDEKVIRIAKELNKDLMHKYTRNNARITDFMLGKGGNCDAETRLMLSVLHALDLDRGSGDWVFGVQDFVDHIQPVLYNKRKDTVTNLVSNGSVIGVVTPLVKPEYYFYVALPEKTATSIITSKSDLILIEANPDIVAATKKLQKDWADYSYRTNTKFRQDGFSNGVRYWSGPIPTHATISFSNGTSPVPVTDTVRAQDDDFSPGAFVDNPDASSDDETDDEGSIFLKEKLLSDYGNALSDPDLQEYIKIIKNPARIIEKNYSIDDAKSMQRALEHLAKVVTSENDYFTGAVPTDSFDLFFELNDRYNAYVDEQYMKPIALLNEYAYNDFVLKGYYDLVASMTEEQQRVFETLFDHRSFYAASMGFTFGKPDRLSYRAVFRHSDQALRFVDDDKTSFRARFAKSRDLEKIAQDGDLSKTTNREGNVIETVSDSDRVEKQSRAEKKKKIRGLKDSKSNQKKEQLYGRDETGTKNKPEQHTRSYAAELEAETFATYIMRFEMGQNQFGTVAGDELAVRTPILARWSPLLSEELRLNEAEESIELMQWFVEIGFDQIQEARDFEVLPDTAMTKSPTNDKKKIATDLARLYIHYYLKLKSLGVSLGGKPLSKKQIRFYEQLVKERDE